MEEGGNQQARADQVTRRYDDIGILRPQIGNVRREVLDTPPALIEPMRPEEPAGGSGAVKIIQGQDLYGDGVAAQRRLPP